MPNNKFPSAEPCPFCGSSAIQCEHSPQERYAGIPAAVQCLNRDCRAFGPDGATLEEAIRKWNQRATPICPECHNLHMIPGKNATDDVMNTPCPKCNP